MNFDINDLEFDNLANWPMPAKAGLTAVVCALVIFLIYYFDTRDQLIELNAASAQETQLKAQLKTLHEKAANLDAYRIQMTELEKRFHDMLKKLPSTTEMPELLDGISRSGHTSGLSFQTIEPQPEINQDFYVELPIRITVNGQYHQMGDFVSQVSNLDRIVTLHDFTIAAEELQPLNMKIDAKIYHYNDESIGELSSEGEVSS